MLQNNVAFKGAKRDETFKTTAMVNEAAKNQEAERSKNSSVQPQFSTQDMARHMRAANFKMGSVQPEHDRMHSIELARPSDSNFRANPKSINAASQLIHNDRVKTMGVSEGNPLNKGKRDFVTNNMQQMKWI